MANWLRLPTLPVIGDGITTMQHFTIRFVVEIDLVDYEYIGLPDLMNDEGYCNDYVFGDATHGQFKNWLR